MFRTGLESTTERTPLAGLKLQESGLASAGVILVKLPEPPMLNNWKLFPPTRASGPTLLTTREPPKETELRPITLSFVKVPPFLLTSIEVMPESARELLIANVP